MGQDQSTTSARSNEEMWTTAQEEARTLAVGGKLPVAPPTVAPLALPGDAHATMDYLSRIIAQAEEQGADSRHDLALLRFHLDTIRQQASRRREDHHQKIEQQLEEELEEATNATTHDSQPTLTPQTKRIKHHQAAPPFNHEPQQQPESLAEAAQLPEDDLLPPEVNPIEFIGLQQAQIHAANMTMIRHQHEMLRRQLPHDLLRQQTQDEPPPPWDFEPQLHSPMAASAASVDWPMDVVGATVVDGGGYLTPNPSDERLYGESLAQEPPIAPWSPSMALALDDHDLPQLPTTDRPPLTLQSPPKIAEVPSPGSAHSNAATTEDRPTPENSSPAAAATASDSIDSDVHSLPDQEKATSALETSGDQAADPQLPAGFVKATPTDRSAVFLSNCLNSGALELLERNYGQGNFSAAGIRQVIMGMASQLEPDDQDELMNSFSRMNLKGCEEVLSSCPHLDIQPVPGVPCCPQRAGAGFRSDLFKKARAEFEAKAVSLPDADRLPFAEAMAKVLAGDTQLADALTSAFAQDLSPSEAAPDDLDGVARMRLNVIFSKPSPAKHKRKKKSLDGDAGDDPTCISSVSSVSSVASRSSAAQSQLRIHRMVQVNKAYEAMHGFSQANIRRNMVLKSHSGGAFDSVRRDHLRSAHQIQMNWRLNNVNEGHIYQVRLRLDRRPVYCIMHVKFTVDHGVMLAVEHAIIPLPVDDAHPMPPFVEGVDLDVDTLLYGYKPPLKLFA